MTPRVASRGLEMRIPLRWTWKFKGVDVGRGSVVRGLYFELKLAMVLTL